jgi:hypothetical protein
MTPDWPHSTAGRLQALSFYWNPAPCQIIRSVPGRFLGVLVVVVGTLEVFTVVLNPSVTVTLRLLRKPLTCTTNAAAAAGKTALPSQNHITSAPCPPPEGYFVDEATFS